MACDGFCVYAVYEEPPGTLVSKLIESHCAGDCQECPQVLASPFTEKGLYITPCKANDLQGSGEQSSAKSSKAGNRYCSLGVVVPWDPKPEKSHKPTTMQIKFGMIDGDYGHVKRAP